MLKNRLKQEMISFSEKFFSASNTVQATKDQLEDQMNEYRQIIDEASTQFGKTRITYSGKGDTQQDDLVISLLLNIYWLEKFYCDDMYARYH